MKRCWMLLSLMMILLLCGHAAAELFAPVPAERLVFMEVPGLVADVVKTPGRVTLNVDVENTDWEKVTTYTYDGVNPGLNIFFGFTPPDGAV